MSGVLGWRLVPSVARPWLLGSRACSTAAPSLLTEHLTSRGVLRLRGPETATFLQGLITNDVRHFQDGARAIYAMMLNTKGRVLFDLFVYRHDDEGGLFLEADRSLLSKLQSLLKIYRVRKKIDIDDISEETTVVSVQEADSAAGGGQSGAGSVSRGQLEAPVLCETGASAHSTALLDLPLAGPGPLAASRDPRLPALGWRLVLDSLVSVDSVLPGSRPGGELRLTRHTLGVAEGAEEIPHAGCTPLEYNADYLHGVSFHKGCYVGQELTARTHHTGVVRKRVMPLSFARPPAGVSAGASAVDPAGKTVGRVLGISGDRGIGLMRIAQSLSAPHLVVEGTDCIVQTFKPSWWPQEASKESMTRGN